MELPVVIERIESRYVWDRRLRNGTGAYRDRITGRIVSTRAVRSVLDDVLDRLGDDISRESDRLRSGEISLAEWQSFLARTIPHVHLASVALSRGGWAQMREADYEFAEEQIRFNLERLRDFANQIADGTQPLDGRMARRALMYADAGRTTFHLAELEEARLNGYDEVRSVRTVRDSCRGCIEQADIGWQPLDQFVPIGMRDCLTNDRCFAEFRQSSSGAILRVDA